MEHFKAHIIFDNDGTLVDSESNFFESMEVLLPKYMGRPVSLEEIQENYLPDWRQFLINFGFEDPSPEFTQTMIDDLIAMNVGYMPPLFPGMLEVLEQLKQRKIGLYIWTGRDSKSAIEIFKTHKIARFFQDMHFLDSCIPKPHPDGPTQMLGKKPKEKILLIGDSVVDVEGARRFKIPCLVVDWHKKAKPGHFEGLGATKVITEPSEILRYVDRHLL